ncbi:MAG: DUF4368 domain-containing protein [Clostridia bacterium]|nr:DUF4368 domain-containing protein [Clostridia bacterium]
MNDMTNAIYVHAPEKSSGHRVQNIEISYNYIGILSSNLLYDIQNGNLLYCLIGTHRGWTFYMK